MNLILLLPLQKVGKLMVKHYIKKPQLIEAIQFTGDNIEEIQAWSKQHLEEYTDGTFGIPTLEGIMRADVNDYIIKGIKGEFYPCKPDIFILTYDQV